MDKDTALGARMVKLLLFCLILFQWVLSPVYAVNKPSPAVQKSVVVAKKTAPVSKKNLSVAKKTAPVSKKNPSVGKKSAPVSKKNPSVDKKSAPAAKKPPIWYDLSHNFDRSTIYWPNAPHFKLTRMSYGKTRRGYFYSANKFSAAEHGGTHMDAPSHFARGKQSVDEVPIASVMGDGVVIDVSKRALNNVDYRISVKDILRYEKKFGKIKPQTIVMFHTGYVKYWFNRRKYLGTNRWGRKAARRLHFPGLAPEAAQWLLSKRKVKAVGIDTASIDYGQSRLFNAHRVFAKNNIPIFENLANMKKLLNKKVDVIALPMKIKNGSGAPVRIIAKVK